jgi:prepilin-type N-terminal cleavage/methylation domain-containing protein
MFFRTRSQGHKVTRSPGKPTSTCDVVTCDFVTNHSGFTFIEILITLTVIALLFVPVMQLFSNSLYSTGENLDRITAMNLAQSEMEKTINLNMTKAQLLKDGTKVFPPLDGPPYAINKGFWRVQREVVEASDPVEVRVKVFKDGFPDKVLVTLTTLVEDLMWDQVTAVQSNI